MNVHSTKDTIKNSPKRDDILAAALRLVSQHGFHGTAMSMLAAEANCGAGTIYNYFKGKDDLLEALFRKLKTEFMTAVLADDVEGAPLEQRFMHMWRNSIHFFITYPEKLAYFQQYHSSPYFTASTAEFVAQAVAPMIHVYETAMKSGKIRIMPQPVLESITMDVAQSLAKRHVSGEIILTEELIHETGSACWQALQILSNERKADA